MLMRCALLAIMVSGATIVLWQLPTDLGIVPVGPWPVAVAADDRTGHVFVINNTDGRHPGTVTILNAATGDVIRTIAVGVLPVAVAIDERRGHVFVINQKSSSVSMLDATSGQVLHTIGVGRVPAAIVVDETTGRAFVPTGTGDVPHSGQVSIIDTARGALLRTVRVGDAPVAVAVDTHTQRVFVPTEGTMICPSSRACHLSGSAVSILDARRGTVIRTVLLGTAPRSVVVDQRAGRAVISAGGGRVSLLDTRTGQVLHTGTIAQEVNELAVDSQTGRVFVLCSNDQNSDSSVSTLDVHSGRVLQTTRIGHAASPMAVDELRGRVVIANVNDSTLSVIDARTGRLVRTLTAIAQGPTALAVSKRLGHIFVASADVSNGPASSTSNDHTLLALFGHMAANGLKVLRHGQTGSVRVLDARALH